MGLFIRDDTVRHMAKRLAEARHTTVTEAVRQALARDLARIESDRVERDRAIRQIWAELDAMPDREFGDEDMYDETGAPR